MKKMIAILTALIMILALAGCAKTGDVDASASAQPTEETQQSERPDAPPEAPDGTPPAPPDGQGGNPPTPPDGQGGNPPTPPDGQGGNPPTPPDGQGGNPPTPPDGQGGNPPGGPGGSGTGNVEYKGAETITEAGSFEGKSYTSSASDENALIVSASGEVDLKDIAVEKTGDSDGGDNCSFYGVNSAVLVKDGATAVITGGTIKTSAEGANAVFSYGGNGGRNGAEGDGTKVVISDVEIITTAGGSGGIMTAGGGVTEAHDLTVNTAGRSSAAIRSDRGGGTVTVYGGTYTTSGIGSPAVYSTADITATDAELTAELSEGVVIEGRNSVTLNGCTLTANNTQTNSNATFHDTVMIYQSMSGDAAEGESVFTMNGGKIVSRSGHVFHVTNTNAKIVLDGVEIVNEDADGVLLSVCADGWSGAGNKAELIAKGQKLSGTILVGSDSELTLELTEGTEFTGCISGDITNAKGEKISSEVGSVTVKLDASSTWTLTADCSIAAFEGDPAQIVSNGYKLYVAGTPLSGTN